MEKRPGMRCGRADPPGERQPNQTVFGAAVDEGPKVLQWHMHTLSVLTSDFTKPVNIMAAFRCSNTVCIKRKE